MNNKVENNMLTPDDIINSINSEKDAREIIRLLWHKFGMVGTSFCRGDIESMARGLLTEEEIDEITDSMLDNHLFDYAIQTINETLEGEVLEYIRSKGEQE